MKKLSEIVFENKVTQEVVHADMVGIHELMTDDKFLDWFEKLSDKILSKLTMYEIYQKFQREVKK